MALTFDDGLISQLQQALAAQQPSMAPPLPPIMPSPLRQDGNLGPSPMLPPVVPHFATGGSIDPISDNLGHFSYDNGATWVDPSGNQWVDNGTPDGKWVQAGSPNITWNPTDANPDNWQDQSGNTWQGGDSWTDPYHNWWAPTPTNQDVWQNPNQTQVWTGAQPNRWYDPQNGDYTTNEGKTWLDTSGAQAFPVLPKPVAPAVQPLTAGAHATSDDLTSFGAALAKRLGYDPKNVTAVLAELAPWEGGSPDNPLNTTYSMSPNDKVFNSSGVKRYSDVPTGVEATAKTLELSYYPHLRAALQSGVLGEAAMPDLWTWGTRNYVQDWYKRHGMAVPKFSGGATIPAYADGGDVSPWDNPDTAFPTTGSMYDAVTPPAAPGAPVAPPSRLYDQWGNYSDDGGYTWSNGYVSGGGNPFIDAQLAPQAPPTSILDEIVSNNYPDIASNAPETPYAYSPPNPWAQPNMDQAYSVDPELTPGGQVGQIYDPTTGLLETQDPWSGQWAPITPAPFNWQDPDPYNPGNVEAAPVPIGEGIQATTGASLNALGVPGTNAISNVLGNVYGGAADAATLGALSGLGPGPTDATDPHLWLQGGMAALNAGGFYGPMVANALLGERGFADIAGEPLARYAMGSAGAASAQELGQQAGGPLASTPGQFALGTAGAILGAGAPEIADYLGPRIVPALRSANEAIAQYAPGLTLEQAPGIDPTTGLPSTADNAIPKYTAENPTRVNPDWIAARSLGKGDAVYVTMPDGTQVPGFVDSSFDPMRNRAVRVQVGDGEAPRSFARDMVSPVQGENGTAGITSGALEAVQQNMTPAERAEERAFPQNTPQPPDTQSPQSFEAGQNYQRNVAAEPSAPGEPVTPPLPKNVTRLRGALEGTITPQEGQAITDFVQGRGASPLPPSDADLAAMHASLQTPEPPAPEPPEIAATSEAFRAKASRALVDAINLPRAFKAGFDMSATLRQALPLGSAHPITFGKALVAQVRAIASQGAYDSIVKDIEESPLAPMRRSAGLFLASTSKDAALNAREEAFLTRLAGKIPGLKATERGYVVMLDKLRADVFDSTIERWMKQGYQPTGADQLNLAEFINHATGRGTGALLDNVAQPASLGFFSPRYMVSRPQLIADLFMRGGPVRAEVAKSLVAWVGGIAALDALAVAGGVGGVDINPLSGGFGKLQIGRESYDLSGGMTGDIRTLAQTIMGQRENAKGAIVPANRLDTLGRYLRGKLSPTAALVVDALQGADYNGNSIDWSKLTGPGSGGAEAFNTFGNLFANDVAKAAKVEFGNGVSATRVLQFAATATAALLGASVNSYDSDFLQRDRAVADAFKGQKDSLGNDITSYAQLNHAQKVQWNATHSQPQGNPEQEKQFQATQAKYTAIDDTYRDKLEAISSQFQNDGNGENFRDSLTAAAIARRAARAQQDLNTPFPKPNTPEDQAVDKWYALYDQAMGLNGKIDPNMLAAKQADFLQTLDAKTRDYVLAQTAGKPSQPSVLDAQLSPTGKPNVPEVVQQYYDDLQKLAPYWSATASGQGGERYLESHPETAALLEKYGYAHNALASLQIHKAYDTAIAANDDGLSKGTVTATQWRDQLHAIQDDERSKLEGLYTQVGTSPYDSAPQDPKLKAYYDFIDSTKPQGPDGQPLAASKPDWNAVDRYLADHPDMQSAVDEATAAGRPVSPTVQKYRDAVKEISDVGYWDVKDEYAKQFAQYYGLPSTLDDYGKVRGYLRQTYLPQVEAAYPNNPSLASAKTEDYIDKLLSSVDKQASAVQKAWRLQSPDLLNLLVQWGFYSPSKQAETVLSRYSASQ